MENIGLDLHQRESQLCILTEEGEVIERRIRTTPERLTAVLGPRAPARILLEASTESEWVARHLEALGHTVIVADPNYAPMYATRSARVKTDRRDARTLADALRLEAYRPAHRSGDAHRHVRAELAVRDTLVGTRTRYVALAKALVRREGFRLASGAAEHPRAKLAALPLPPPLTAELAPLVALLPGLDQEIAAADRRLAQYLAADPVVQRLATAPGIGPVTATAFVATLDEVTRFATAHQVEAYLGLVPSERSSGERRTRHAAGSPKPATPGCAGCWSRRRGGCCAHRALTPRRCGRGPSGSRSAGASGSRWSPWPGGSPACSTRCGGTGPATRSGGAGKRRPPRTAGLGTRCPTGAASTTQLVAAGEAVHQFGAAAPIGSPNAPTTTASSPESAHRRLSGISPEPANGTRTERTRPTPGVA